MKNVLCFCMGWSLAFSVVIENREASFMCLFLSVLALLGWLLLAHVERSAK